MKAPIDIGNKFRENIYFRYPSFVDILQENYQTELIQCMKEDIEKYHVLFWYRLLKNIYQDPYELECELQINNVKKPVQEETAIFRKTDEKNNWSVLRVSDENLSKLKNGEIKPFPINWKYFVQLPTGGIVELGTKDRTTVFYIALIVRASNLVKKTQRKPKSLFQFFWMKLIG